MSFPISSVLVAAEAICISEVRPDCETKCFITNSAIGERQMLPWQMKRIFSIMSFLSKVVRFAVFCEVTASQTKCSFCWNKRLFHSQIGKTLQVWAVKRSKSVVEIRCITTIS